jgi:imidazoleglycerol phosphate synthase cyclase subunit
MLTTRIIPCLDVRDGRVVKGVRFANRRDAGGPAARAAIYQEQGADEIAILDVTATLENRDTRYSTIESVRREVSIPITAGGGVQSIEDAAQLLARGADKVSVNSAAVSDPDLLEELANRFGTQCVVLAIDASRTPDGGWVVRTRSGTRTEALDAITWAREGCQRGAGEILLTSFDRDGTRSGYDTRLLSAVREVVQVPLIASGGASTPGHMVDAVRAGADAVLAASIFHEGEWSIADLKAELATCGLEVRS